MVFLQGSISESDIAVDCFELFENGIVEIFVSEDVLTEIQDVVTRPKLQAKHSRLTDYYTKSIVIFQKIAFSVFCIAEKANIFRLTEMACQKTFRN